MRHPRFSPHVPSKERERGAYRRHQRERAFATRYRRIAERRLTHPTDIHPDFNGCCYVNRGHGDWSDVIAWRRCNARRELDTRTVCSCWMCGNPRRFGLFDPVERAALWAFRRAVRDGAWD
jgi:hypothetical protein